MLNVFKDEKDESMEQKETLNIMNQRYLNGISQYYLNSTESRKCRDIQRTIKRVKGNQPEMKIKIDKMIDSKTVMQGNRQKQMEVGGDVRERQNLKEIGMDGID